MVWQDRAGKSSPEIPSLQDALNAVKYASPWAKRREATPIADLQAVSLVTQQIDRHARGGTRSGLRTAFEKLRGGNLGACVLFNRAENEVDARRQRHPASCAVSKVS